jgi:hypothetical protein
MEAVIFRVMRRVISTCEILASHCRIRHPAVVQRQWRCVSSGYTQV